MFSLTDQRATRAAWLLWLLLFLLFAVVMLAGSTRTVVPSYRMAALSWVAGQGLYDGTGVGGFVYFPHAAILFIPFAIIPEVLSEVLWRFLNIAVFAFGLYGLATLAGKRSGTSLFLLMTLVAIPLVWDCARNGQATLAMTALMLLAVLDVAGNRWWRATLWLMLGVAVKPLIIVLVLLIMAIDRPMTWRVLAGLALTALSPFLTQHPAYVFQQYATCLHNTMSAASVGVVLHGWTTPFTALRVAGIDVPEHVQTLIRMIAAFATLALCFFVRFRHDAARSAVFVFALAACYVILFSPRTENNTYAMLGPAIGVFLAQAILVEKRYAAGLMLSVIALGAAAGGAFARLIAPHTEAIWMSPIMGTCFGAYLLTMIFKDRKTRILER